MCRGGYAVHAEYVIVPYNLLAQLPDTIDFDSAAFSTGSHCDAWFPPSQAGLGESVGVIGLGLLGLLAVGIARAAGARSSVDLDETAVRLASQMGATAVARDQAIEAAMAFSRGMGDHILICAGHPFTRPG
jgi:threonine dehydrogenase-like Zn-dependent dehydrogenase